jgi:hypothetical protein
MSEDKSFADFDNDVREAVEGLIHLGELSDDFEFCGHTFGLRTLRMNEEIAAAKVIEPFRNTIKEPEAWIAAQIGLSLIHIDGEVDFCPKAGPDQVSFARARFNYVTGNWYWPTIDFLYQGYSGLLLKQIEAMRAVQDLSPGTLLSSWPSADSFTAPATSNDEMISEIRNFRE